MRKSRYTDEQIVMALRQAEAGTPVVDVCRKLQVTEQTFYRWRRKVGSQCETPEGGVGVRKKGGSLTLTLWPMS